MSPTAASPEPCTSTEPEQVTSAAAAAQRTTPVNGVGLWKSWQRNFNTRESAFLDLMDNAVDAANIHSKTGKIEIYADECYGERHRTQKRGLVLMNTSQDPIKNVDQILEVFRSTKENSAESVGENGVGLKQGCAALANCSFVLIRMGNDLHLGVIAKALQRKEGCFFPHYYMGKVSTSEKLSDMLHCVMENPADDWRLANCLEDYGGGCARMGARRLKHHIKRILWNEIWAREEHVFMLILSDLIHGQKRKRAPPTPGGVKNNLIPPPTRTSSDDVDSVDSFIDEIRSILPKQYIHIPSSFHLRVGGKPIEFEYWPNRLVALTEFGVPIVKTHPFYEDAYWNQMKHRDKKDWYLIKLYIGFDGTRCKTKGTASLFVYSRKAGRLITKIDDVRSFLSLGASGTDYCQGLTIILDDEEGNLPLNPTKQDLAFGEEEDGDSHKTNLYAWAGACAYAFWNHYFEMCNKRKELLGDQVSSSFVGTTKPQELRPLRESYFNKFVAPEWKKYKKTRIRRANKRYSGQKGPDTYFQVQPPPPPPSLTIPKSPPSHQQTTKKKRKRSLEEEDTAARGSNDPELEDSNQDRKPRAVEGFRSTPIRRLAVIRTTSIPKVAIIGREQSMEQKQAPAHDGTTAQVAELQEKIAELEEENRILKQSLAEAKAYHL